MKGDTYILYIHTYALCTWNSPQSTPSLKVVQCSLHAQQHKVSPSCMVKGKLAPLTASPLPLVQVMLEKLRKMDAEVLKCIEALILGCRCGQHM